MRARLVLTTAVAALSTALATGQDAPTLQVRIVIDLTSSLTVGSMFIRDVHEEYLNKQLLPDMKELAQALRASESASIATVGEGIAVSSVWTRDGEVLARELRRLDQSGGPSTIFDAVLEIVDMFRETGFDRTGKAILLLTDGFAGGNRYGSAEVIGKARERAAPVHVIRLSTHRIGITAESTNAQARKLLERLARETGGSYHECDLRQGHSDRDRCLVRQMRAALDAARAKPRGPVASAR